MKFHKHKYIWKYFFVVKFQLHKGNNVENIGNSIFFRNSQKQHFGVKKKARIKKPIGVFHQTKLPVTSSLLASESKYFTSVWDQYCSTEYMNNFVHIYKNQQEPD